jgi:signal transduction histidine kinase
VSRANIFGIRRSWFRVPEARRGTPLTRSRTDRVVAGVAGGAAARFGIDPVLLRIGFVIFSVAGGTGAVIYMLAWLLVPAEGEKESLAVVALRDRRQTSLVAAVTVLTLAGLLFLRALGLWFNNGLIFPAVLAAAGLAVIWRQAGEEDKAPLARVLAQLPWVGSPGAPHDRLRRVAVARVMLGAGLVVGGVTAFLATTHAFAALREGVVATVGIVGGMALIFGPWWLRLVRELAEERRDRIRSDERAEVAARVHDSVLQTLALIQRQADDPRAVMSLARGQERELRSWLYGAPPEAADERFRSALDRAGEEVEQLHGVTVDAVTVGDCEMDEQLGAVVAAAREAMTNAAKWSGTRSISVYAEVEDDRVSVFVRDRGAGFDPTSIGPGHQGIAHSIKGRMQRHGGTAVVTSTPGEGTEVELRVPRTGKSDAA